MLQLTPIQQRFVDDPARVKLLVGLRGSGKTTAAIVALLKIVQPGKTYGICVGRPSYLGDTLVWILGNQGILGSIFMDKREIHTTNGGKLIWFGPRDWDRIRGRPLAGDRIGRC